VTVDYLVGGKVQLGSCDTVPLTLLLSAEKGLTGDYLVGGKVSWADIILYHFVKELPSQDALKDAPKVTRNKLYSICSIYFFKLRL
jgi:hypothetical protein